MSYPFSPNIDNRYCKGVSLLELAVVIAVIGFLVGGVVVGKHMIRSANIQESVARIQYYTSAVHKFRDRYYALPGDMPNATDFWGSVNGTTDVNCVAPPSASAGDDFGVGTGTETCNGNGDGHIGGVSGLCGEHFEPFRAWQHLANAGLIEGQYTGNTGSRSNYDAVPGENVPATPIQGGGYSLRDCGSMTGQNYYFDGVYGHTIQLGGAKITGSGNFTRRPLFTTQEALTVDKKLDDSYPHKGNIRAPQSDDSEAPNCTNSPNSAPATADYDINQTDKKCPLFFLLGF